MQNESQERVAFENSQPILCVEEMKRIRFGSEPREM